MKLTAAQMAQGAAIYANGASIAKAAASLACGAMTLHRALKRLGVQTRNVNDTRRGKPWTEARRSKTPKREPRPTRAELAAEAIGNKSLSSHGYVRVNLGQGKRQYEHILIAERVLGRPLRSNERVHHINCDRADNRNCNLLICTHEYHLALHARMRAAGYP